MIKIEYYKILINYLINYQNSAWNDPGLTGPGGQGALQAEKNKISYNKN